VFTDSKHNNCGYIL